MRWGLPAPTIDRLLSQGFSPRPFRYLPLALFFLSCMGVSTVHRGSTGSYSVPYDGSSGVQIPCTDVPAIRTWYVFYLSFLYVTESATAVMSKTADRSRQAAGAGSAEPNAR